MSKKQENKGAVLEDRAGKYLTFRLADEEFGIEILKVREIIGMMNVTPVPRAPEYIRGVINLRGKIIPVLDLRNIFRMEASEDTDETCIIVAEIRLNGESILMGTVVDAVSEVLDIKENEIEDSPAFGSNVDTKFILGIGKVKNEVKILLDIDEVLAVNESAVLLKLSEDDVTSADIVQEEDIHQLV
ncbi:MAG: chemotaxis protein CheW [Candidatus Zixiibacteriota bacterium]